MLCFDWNFIIIYAKSCLILKEEFKKKKHISSKLSNLNHLTICQEETHLYQDTKDDRIIVSVDCNVMFYCSYLYILLLNNC